MKIGKKVTVTYQYDSKGNKLEELRKVQRAAALRHQTQYCGNYIFENGVLRCILVDGGFIYFSENDTTYHYFLKDHLGSNRAVVNAKTGQVAEQYDYYPFGKQHGDYHTGYIHPYRYNGKELDGIAGVDWLYYGARMMEPEWGRFTTPDPMAEKYYDVSPYVYCANNPSNMVDYDGCDYWSTNDQEQIKAFINAMGSGQTQFDFSGWNHATDAEICGNLTYNDETHKFYTSYTSVVDGELTVIGKSFDANITPVSYSGLGYEGAYVYQPTTSSWKKIILSLDGGLKYNDGQNNWNVNLSGRITGLAPIEGVVDINTPAQRSKAIMTLLSKGAKVCKSFGTIHGEKIFQLGNRYYSFDNTQHNGGIYKVFEREGGNLKRIGTADKDLRIFKKMTINMDRIIKDDVFLKKVFKRQIKQGIAYHSCVMDYLTISQKVKYTIRRLSEIPILSARIIIQYWEDDKTMMRMLSRHKINDYCVVRGYKNGQTPGYLNIDIDKKVFNPKFVKELLNRHYGNDFSKQNAIDIIPYVVIDTSEDEIIAFHLYDDRGYYEYYIPKKNNVTKER